MYKEGIFYTQIFFKLVFALYRWTMWPKKHYFYKGSTPSDWNRSRLSRAEIQVCVSTKLSSWPMGWAICDFLPFFSVAAFFLWNAYFYSAKHAWTPNRLLGGPRTATFLKNAVPKPTVRHIYIYIYIYVCVWVIIWSKFGPFRSQYLVQGGVIIWSKFVF